MMSYCFVMVLSCLVFAGAETTFKGKHLPNYIIPCSKSSPNLNACSLENGKLAIPTLLKGDKKFKLPVLAPLKLDRVEVKPSNNFELILTDIILSGLEHLELKDINIVEGKKHAELILTGDGIRIISDYKVSGQILVLPISGEGKADLKFDDLNIKYTFDYDVIEKGDGKAYGIIKKSNVALKINKAKFNLDNLFNGNKELGDDMNKVLNENYEAVLKDLDEALSTVIDTIATGIISSFLGSIPYDEIFLP